MRAERQVQEVNSPACPPRRRGKGCLSVLQRPALGLTHKQWPWRQGKSHVGGSLESQTRQGHWTKRMSGEAPPSLKEPQKHPREEGSALNTDEPRRAQRQHAQRPSNRTPPPFCTPAPPTSEPQQEAIEAAGEGEGEDGEKLGFLAAAGLSQAEGQ